MIGSRFTPDLLGSLGIEPTLDDLVGAALIDQVRFTPFTEYAFRHPLIRTVAYESQLKSARAELHQRLAAAIEEHDPSAADENAALIAEHLEAAGDLRGAYGWHMRAGAWAINRDVVAARLSWERARAVADSLLPDEPDRLAMRIAPRTMCRQRPARNPGIRRTPLRGVPRTVRAAGDHASLAIGMTGLVAEHMQFGRVPEAMKLADEQTALVESLDVVLVSVAVFPTIAIRSHGGDTAGVLKWSQTVIDWAEGDPAKGSFAIGSPLAVALVLRGGVRWWLGEDGWREDLDEAAAIARTADPSTLGFVFPWCYGLGIFNGVLLADDAAIADIEAALQIAEASGDDNVLGSIKYTLSTVLMHRAGAAGNRRAPRPPHPGARNDSEPTVPSVGACAGRPLHRSRQGPNGRRRRRYIRNGTVCGCHFRQRAVLLPHPCDWPAGGNAGGPRRRRRPSPTPIMRSTGWQPNGKSGQVRRVTSWRSAFAR